MEAYLKKNHEIISFYSKYNAEFKFYIKNWVFSILKYEKHTKILKNTQSPKHTEKRIKNMKITQITWILNKKFFQVFHVFFFREFSIDFSFVFNAQLIMIKNCFKKFNLLKTTNIRVILDILILKFKIFLMMLKKIRLAFN